MINAFPKIFTLGTKYIQDIFKKSTGIVSKDIKTDSTKWEACITRVSNGFILTLNSYGEEGMGEEIMVYGDKEDCVYRECYGERHSFIDLCWELVDYFGLSGSRYDSERIYMTLKSGDKYHDD